MTIQRGEGFTTLIDHSFASDIADIIEEADEGYANIIVGGSMRCTGAAAVLGLSLPGSSLQDPPLSGLTLASYSLADGGVARFPNGLRVMSTSEDSPWADVASGSALDFVGGAGSAILNGTIYFITVALSATS